MCYCRLNEKSDVRVILRIYSGAILHIKRTASAKIHSTIFNK
jgi:hypothetical protein